MNKNKGFMKKAAAVTVIAATAAVIIVPGFLMDDSRAGSRPEIRLAGMAEQTAAAGMPVPEIQEISIPDTEGGKVYRSMAGGYSFTVPAGCTLGYSGGTCYIRKGKSVELSLTVTSLTYTDGNDLYNSRQDYISRLCGFFGGEEKKLVTCGTAERKKKEVSGYPVVYENTEAWFKNDGDAMAEKTRACLYYTVMPEKENSTGDADSGMRKGVILAGFSGGKGEKQMQELMDTLLGTLEPYIPEEGEPVVSELSEYRSPERDGAVIAYPLGWKVSENGDGMVTIQPDGDDAGTYAGFAIEYFPDTENRIVDDYAQFSGNYEYQILSACFTRPVGDRAYDYRTVVTDTDMDAAIGEKECIRFDVTDQIVPVSKSVRDSMNGDRYDVNNIRYTFRSNGVDCMLNFMVPNDSFLPLVEMLLSKTQLD